MSLSDKKLMQESEDLPSQLIRTLAAKGFANARLGLHG
jgi:hypothetical protein